MLYLHTMYTWAESLKAACHNFSYQGTGTQLDWMIGLDDWTGRLDWMIGLDDWTGRLDWTIGPDKWTGQVDWTIGLDDWTGWLDGSQWNTEYRITTISEIALNSADTAHTIAIQQAQCRQPCHCYQHIWSYRGAKNNWQVLYKTSIVVLLL